MYVILTIVNNFKLTFTSVSMPCTVHTAYRKLLQRWDRKDFLDSDYFITKNANYKSMEAKEIVNFKLSIIVNVIGQY